MGSSDKTNENVFLILGATGGIGSELVKLLRSRGSSVILACRNKELLEKRAREIDGDYYTLDATKFDQLDDCIKYVMDKYGRLDGVANCVGSIYLKPAHLTDEDSWEKTILLNLKTAFAAVRSSVQSMKKNGGGSIVLVSSAAASVGLSSHEAISAAKAGIIGLVYSAAATYARYNIRVNCVSPGLVETPLTNSLTENKAVLKKSTSMHALGRIGKPFDVASAMAFLLNPDNNWITGQVLGVDGGLANLRAR